MTTLRQSTEKMVEKTTSTAAFKVLTEFVLLGGLVGGDPDLVTNRILATLASICVTCDNVCVGPLRRRAVTANPHHLLFYAPYVSLMKEYRKDLKSRMFSLSKTVGDPELASTGFSPALNGYVTEYVIKGGRDVLKVQFGEIKGFWISVKVVSRKKTNVHFFPVFDTQGSYVAVDDGVREIYRVSYRDFEYVFVKMFWDARSVF
jgi:hypothetical protein